MATFFPKSSSYTGQIEPDKLKDYLLSVDKDLDNLFKAVFVFSQHNIINMENRSGLPSSTAYVGYLCIVGGKLNVCIASGTPGTWHIVGSYS